MAHSPFSSRILGRGNSSSSRERLGFSTRLTRTLSACSFRRHKPDEHVIQVDPPSSPRLERKKGRWRILHKLTRKHGRDPQGGHNLEEDLRASTRKHGRDPQGGHSLEEDLQILPARNHLRKDSGEIMPALEDDVVQQIPMGRDEEVKLENDDQTDEIKQRDPYKRVFHFFAWLAQKILKLFVAPCYKPACKRAGHCLKWLAGEIFSVVISNLAYCWSLKHQMPRLYPEAPILSPRNFPVLYNVDGHITGPAIYHFQQVEARGAVFWLPLLFAIGLAESYRVGLGWATPGSADFNSLRDDYEPGNLGFDPLGLLPSDPVAKKDLQTKELNNGRLAMIAIAAFVVQELVSGDEIFAHTFKKLGI